MFKARNAKSWQREFPVGFPVYTLCFEFVIHQHFSRFCCLCRKQMRDLSKTCLATELIRSILRWKNCTCAEALVQFFRAKIERINTVARHVLLHAQMVHWPINATKMLCLHIAAALLLLSGSIVYGWFVLFDQNAMTIVDRIGKLT